MRHSRLCADPAVQADDELGRGVRRVLLAARAAGRRRDRPAVRGAGACCVDKPPPFHIGGRGPVSDATTDVSILAT